MDDEETYEQVPLADAPCDLCESEPWVEALTITRTVNGERTREKLFVCGFCWPS